MAMQTPRDPVELAAVVLSRLAARGDTLATAESLTGGMLGGVVTSVPGSSETYVGGVVSYATALKVSLLDVPLDLVTAHGVVSEECARAMAAGVRALTGADWALATTGIAGPGASNGVPAGSVWVAAVGATREAARSCELPGDRADVRRGACVAALDLLLEIQPVA